MNTHRQIVKAADVVIALGKSKSTSAKILRNIRKVFDKLPHQPITIEEFSIYFGFDKSIITSVIISNDQKKSKPPFVEAHQIEKTAEVKPEVKQPEPILEPQPQRIKKSEPDQFARRALYEKTRFSPKNE